MSVALERILTEAETSLLQRHLSDCLDCRNFEVQVKFIHRAASRFRSGE
ncbi:hypothetical protein BWI17_09045 [Betaproteobacteria bacterium GR16-43]|nr:hypothetical protein BWI17_09045 [Betaproteobacteria bacterium GR16-43]